MITPPAVGIHDLEILIRDNIPRDALMALEDAHWAADKKCNQHASRLFDGSHRSTGAGYIRHLFNNENFHEVLTVLGANPPPLRGNRLVVGKIGIFNISRLNVPGHKWLKKKGSKTREILAQVNKVIERNYVHGDFFEESKPVAEGTVFILGLMDGWNIEANIPALTQVMIAVPSPDMESWLYIKPIKSFLKLYDLPENNKQRDGAVPKLKVQTKKQTGNDQGN